MLTGQLECSFLLPRSWRCVVSNPGRILGVQPWWQIVSIRPHTQRILLQSALFLVLFRTVRHSVARLRVSKAYVASIVPLVAPQENPYERFESASGQLEPICAEVRKA